MDFGDQGLIDVLAQVSLAPFNRSYFELISWSFHILMN